MSTAASGRATKAVVHQVNSTLRRGILAAARSERIGSFVGKHGMRLGAHRFVAGETFDECAEVLNALNERGLKANTTLLGEDVLSAEEARAVTASTRRSSTASPSAACACNVALKLTHLGLCSTRSSPTRTSSASSSTRRPRHFIRLDMEHSGLVDQTLRHLPAAARGRPRRRRHRAAGLPLPHARTTSRRCCRSSPTCGS